MIVRKEVINGCLHIMTINNEDILTLKESELDGSLSTIIEAHIDKIKNFVSPKASNIHLILRFKEMSSLEFLQFCTWIRIYPNNKLEYWKYLNALVS